MSQLTRVKSKLESEGKVSRNYFLDSPSDKILRLGAIIKRLRNEGYVIETKEDERDCVYHLKFKPDGTVPVKVEYQKIVRNGEIIVVRREIPVLKSL